MKKQHFIKTCLVSAMLLTSLKTFAADNQNFQKIDTNVSLGYMFDQTILANGANNQSLQHNQTMNLSVERLFDAGVWLNLNTYMVTNTNSLGDKSTGTGQGYGQPATQNPFLGGLNAKIGYAFTLDHNIQLTPYGIIGRNTNLAMQTILANDYSNVTNDYFYTAGIGGRIEYLVLPNVQLYADQSMSYNWDQSTPLYGFKSQNNIISTSTLGIRYTVSKFLFGASVLYNNYQQQSEQIISTQISGGNDASGNQIAPYQPKESFGGMLTVGMTY